MRGNGLPIGRDPPEEPGCDPLPEVVKRMTVMQAGAETGESKHVAQYVQVTIHIGLADAQLVESAQGAHGCAVLDDDLHGGLARAEAVAAAAPQANLQGNPGAITADPVLNQPGESVRGGRPRGGC